MRTYFLLLTTLILSSSSLSADLLVFRFSGTVLFDGTGGTFTPERPYVLTVTIDTASEGVLIGPQRKRYHNAIKSFSFDYDAGSFVAQGENQGYVEIYNDDRGLYDHFTIGFGVPPPSGCQVPGRSVLGAHCPHN